MITGVETLSDAAATLELSELELLRLTREADQSYRTYRRRKKNGGSRLLCVPSPQLKAAQRKLLKRVLRHYPLSDSCMGFRAGRSIKSNAARHSGHRFVFNTDIEDFFPSISFERVLSVFYRLGCNEIAARALATLTTCRGQLPQGSPSSPVIANIAASDLDNKMVAYVISRDWTYTRYCDDITISGDDRITLSDVIDLRMILASEEFQINEKKTRLRCNGSSQVVTGLVVNEKPNLPRRARHNLRAMFHNARIDPERFKTNRKLLEGHLAYMTMVDPTSPAVAKYRRIFKVLSEQIENRS